MKPYRVQLVFSGSPDQPQGFTYFDTLEAAKEFVANKLATTAEVINSGSGWSNSAVVENTVHVGDTWYRFEICQAVTQWQVLYV
jgi:hypothetical protein